MPEAGDKKDVLGGFIVFLVSLLAYGFALWGIVQYLGDAGVIDWDLSWGESLRLTTIVFLVRQWDRAVFSKN